MHEYSVVVMLHAWSLHRHLAVMHHSGAPQGSHCPLLSAERTALSAIGVSKFMGLRAQDRGSTNALSQLEVPLSR